MAPPAQEIPMTLIDRIQTDHYVIPLPRALEDAMHGTMTGF